MGAIGGRGILVLAALCVALIGFGASASVALAAGPQVKAWVSDVHSDSAQLHAQINPEGEETHYRFEYVDDVGFEAEGFTGATKTPVPDASLAVGTSDQSVSAQLSGLAPGITYHFRLIAHNAGGTTEGPDHTFTTFPYTPSFEDPCPNALSRQQTGAALLLDCRAYELVSAADTGGYDVESDLVPGQTPFGGYPQASDKALYAVHDGGIPNTGNPTNHGPDPYLATRGPSGWTTKYVGMPANNPFASAPFASTLGEATQGLDAFAFAGKDICSPCFADGSTGIPLRTKDGNLVQGMVGSIPVADPEPAGLIGKRFSADGNHFIFGSSSKLEPDANENGDTTIYERDLKTGETNVVSRTPSGGTMSGAGIDQLDVSDDGSRVLIGQLVKTDAEGNDYYHLYMYIGGLGQSIDLTPATTSGALYAGMSADGSNVFFTTTDQLQDDTDQSADLYRSAVNLVEASSENATLTRLSSGSEGSGDSDSCEPAANSARAHWNTVGPDGDCSAVAIGGGGGVATEEGSVYFLSPELLDGSGNGVQEAPNLYLAKPGSAPHFIATLESALNGPQPPAQNRRFLHTIGSFSTPTGISTDSNGDVYVLDVGTNAVERLDSFGNPVNFTFAPGSKEAPGNRLTGADTPTEFFAELQGLGLSAGLAIDASDNLYVPDFLHSVVDVFDSSGNLVPAKQLNVFLPGGVAVDSSGSVYVTKFSGSAVSVFDSSGNEISEFPTISSPRAVAVDSAGTVYIVNGEEAAAYDTSGNFLRQLDSNPSFGVAVDPSNDDVYVNEGDQIARFDSSGARLGAVGDGVLSNSTGIAIDPAGNLYASNTGKGNVAAFGPLSLIPSPLTDNPAVLDALSAAGARHTADFQVLPSGDHAVFPSTLALSGYDNDGHTELFRYDTAGDALDCVSCAPTGARALSDASLPSNGSSLSKDGGVFFTSADALAPRDLNNKKDAYEFSEGETQLISSGSSPTDSGLLSVSADGKDAFFFTREKLAKEDQNGSAVRIYDAREKGGNFLIPTPPPCAASDECHGPSSPQPGPADVKSVAGTAGNLPKATKCRKGHVKKRGRCVKRHASKKQRKANRNRGSGR